MKLELKILGFYRVAAAKHILGHGSPHENDKTFSLLFSLHETKQ